MELIRDNFCGEMTFVRYSIGVDFQFGLLVCTCYIEDFDIPGFVISGFCSIHFT